MVKTETAPNTISFNTILDRFAIILVLIYQFTALVAFVAAPFLAYRWFQQPFLGAFMENTLVINGTGPSRSSESWPAYDAGLDTFGHQVVALDDIEIRFAGDLQRVLSDYAVGDTVTLTALDLDGVAQNYQVSLTSFSFFDQITFFYIPFIIGLVYLGIGMWVFGLRRNDAAGRAFAIFSTSVAIGLGGFFDLYTTHSLTMLWSIGIAVAGTGLYGMGLVFPQQLRVFDKYPVLRWFPTLVALPIILNSLSSLFDLSDPLGYGMAWRYEYIYTGISILFFFGFMAYRRFASRSPIVRDQTHIILLGSVISFGPIGTWMILTQSAIAFSFQPWLLLPLVLFPIATAYAILRYRLLNTDYLISRGITYAILTVSGLGIYLLLAWGASTIFGSFIPNNPILIGLSLAVFAMVINPARNMLQSRVDSIFFRGQTVYQEKMQAFSHDLTRTVELPRIIDLLRRYVDETIGPSQLHIFLYDALGDQYISAENEKGTPTTDIRFSIQSALPKTIISEGASLYLAEGTGLPKSLEPDRARLALLGAQLFVPLPGQLLLTGWLAMGPRKSGEPFRRQSLSFVESLCEQAALAIERAQVVFDLERRVHQMNVLGRIAQGVNVTINFDDMLELIYAQTNQLLPTQDYRITLFHKGLNSTYHAFYLENDERFPEKENRSIPDGYGLEKDIIRGQRPILTDDYERECRSRGNLPSGKGLYAWMGVPLNTGIETIGAMSLGSSDPAVVYTQDQVNILQAIADQAAGAIVKSQLFEETDRRARQLSVLNQVGRSLTSTLETEPLLIRILESAVDILECEAGSLFMIDDDTQELIFQVTVGPVADDLIGRRLPPGTGLVGKSVETQLPLIDNNVQQNKDWREETDQETGFSTRAVLVVPMQIRDQVMGAVQVINKKDGSPFDIEDERLLTAFTAQAAVAVENARLFTMTDKALSAKVEELSVMQRIDRELNAALDTDRSLQITLEWAMRQSQSSAGLAVSLMETDEGGKIIRNLLEDGFQIEQTNEAMANLLRLPLVKRCIEFGQPQRFNNLQDKGVTGLLPSALSQVVIPIRREPEIIGLILLESERANEYEDEKLAFLVRLSDHAAIAVSNARLYDAVQEANIQKSDFVSFVSHELKTPMTSIKGFTDLLIQGAVGTVNDAQGGFLATIRSNVERMDTLVSDLADISRIEAGRLRLNFGTISIRDAVDEVVRSVQRQIKDSEHNLILQIPDDLPKVWGDRTRLIQILTNLVSNAYKYTPKGGAINIRAAPANGSLPSSGDQMLVRVDVTDTGIGMSDDDQNQIFTKFFRSDDQKAQEAPGTGLGLNITKNLVEMQGGTIWFESEYRKGTTFSFTIPIAEN